jgi:hypothetical protein
MGSRVSAIRLAGLLGAIVHEEARYETGPYGVFADWQRRCFCSTFAASIDASMISGELHIGYLWNWRRGITSKQRGGLPIGCSTRGLVTDDACAFQI